jgi:hypothetical protein
MNTKVKVFISLLAASIFAVIYYWHNCEVKYYLSDNESKTLTIADTAINFRRKDDVPRAGITTVYFTDLSATPIKLRVGYYMIYHNDGGDPINWLVTMKEQGGSGYIGVHPPDKKSLVLNYGADHFELMGEKEYTMEIPKHPLLYIAPAEQIISDATSASPATNGR